MNAYPITKFLGNIILEIVKCMYTFQLDLTVLTTVGVGDGEVDFGRVRNTIVSVNVLYLKLAF